MSSKITPKRLSKTGARGKDLDALIREQTQIIDDKLLRSDKIWGRNVIAHDLPDMMFITGLKRMDIQRIVYSALLREYEKRGFETGIVLSEHQNTLYLAYMTDLNAEEVAAMDALIRSRRISPDRVEEWKKHGAVAAPKAASAVRDGRAPPPPALKSANDRVLEPRGGLVPAPAPPGAPMRAAPAPASPAEAALLGLPPTNG